MIGGLEGGSEGGADGGSTGAVVMEGVESRKDIIGCQTRGSRTAHGRGIF